MNTSNVTATKGDINGQVFMCPLPLASGTNLPTDATTNRPAAFKDLGYISEDGLNNSNTPTSTETKSWDGSVVMSSVTERVDKWKFKLLESKNVDVLKLVFGADNVTGTFATGITIKANASDLDENAFIFEMAINGGIKRVVVPKGKLSSLGDVAFKGGEATAFEVEITALPDADGNTHYEYLVTNAD